MAEEKRVKDIMVPIEEYDKVDVDSQLCDALSILKRNYENMKTGLNGRRLHRTIFVTDADNAIVGKISMYDLIRALVPEPAKAPEVSKAYHSMLSSRALEVAEEVSEVQEHYKWLHSSFMDLVKQEAHKKIRDIMKPAQKSVLQEDDRINQAIYVIFKEDVHQQLIHRDGKIVGVVNLNVIFAELLETVGPECHIYW
jgi:CBS domain-containing protein